MKADRYQVLRDAIAAGPTPGPWRADTEGKPDSDMNHGVIAEINDLWIAAMYRSGTTTDGDDKTPEAEAEAAANAHYIAEANPDTIAALLKERDALRADSDRLRWLTEDHADPEARNKCREILGRMPVMSYSAACMVIDSARAALADGEGN